MELGLSAAESKASSEAQAKREAEVLAERRQQQLVQVGWCTSPS
jgi:hypothetical protein